MLHEGLGPSGWVGLCRAWNRWLLLLPSPAWAHAFRDAHSVGGGQACPGWQFVHLSQQEGTVTWAQGTHAHPVALQSVPGTAQPRLRGADSAYG